MSAQKDRLYRDVEYLTKARPKRHNWNPDSFRKASNYTREEFIKTGLDTEKQNGIIYLEITGYFSKHLINEKNKPEQGEYIAIVGNEDYATFNKELYRLKAQGSMFT